MTENEIVQFKYPSESVGRLCEGKVQRVFDIRAVLVRVNIKGMHEMGRCLNDVKELLPHGGYGPWLAWRLPEWCPDTTRKWRVFAERLDKLPPDEQKNLLKKLEKFLSSEAALEFPALPEPVQEQVVDQGAWTWSAFRAVCWDCAMRERLEDPGLDHDHRHGDVRHAIDEVLHDPESPKPLREAAQELYEENRETFARLEGEDASVVDVEVGIEWKEPDTDRPSAQLVEADDGVHWLLRWTGQGPFPFAELERLGFKDITQVQSRILLWQDREPVTLAAMPKTNNGPAAVSWQRAGVTAFSDRLNAARVKTLYGEVL